MRASWLVMGFAIVACCVGFAAERIERHTDLGPAPDGRGNLVKVEDYSDRDNDGIEDTEDECPNDPANRCNIPDTDGDGFQDDVDQCPTTPGTDNGCPSAHDHFDSLPADKVVRKYDLRGNGTGDFSDYRRTRSSRGNVGPANPAAVYDPTLDAMKVTIGPLRNELLGSEMVYLPFSVSGWAPGKKVVVKYECLINEGLAARAWDAGTNGRRTVNYKGFQITTGGSISHEHRIHQSPVPTECFIDCRGYPPKREGRWERDEYASHVADPAFSGELGGGGYDSHPSPFSEWAYKVPPKPHPETFRQRANKWVGVTSEFECVRFVDPVDGVEKQGRRVRTWFADEDTDPVLIVCNPVDPSKGFLHISGAPPDAFWVEFDTSQETTYSEPQPERSVFVRNVAVLQDVSGEEVLGGRPIR
jgi:hypothetical protein